MQPRFLTSALGLLCTIAVAGRLSADSVDTRTGAHLVGKITKIADGTISLETDYAGTLTIKQSEVTTFATDHPIAVRLASGTRFDGQVSAGPNGALQIAGADGTITTSMAKVAATWTAGAVDPALDRHWTYEASVDIAGKTGNKEQLGTAAEVRAVLKTPQDTLQFYSSYDRQVADHQKAADQLKIGTDYQDNFAGKSSWYARDEGGYDRVKDIDLYNIAAAGFGRDFIKEDKRTLTGRLGLSFRYENYKNPITDDVKTLGLDVAINNDMEFSNSKLVNRLSYDPSFDDFSNFRLLHESYYQIPLASPAWKLRVGVSNDYNSKPGPGVKKLDTEYFTRLVLDWE
jgi:putative salt-induced outer membrane protein YdiY